MLIEAEGVATNIIKFINAVKASPSPFGEVMRSQIDKIDMVGYQTFEIR